jgi:hypothetical protein
MFVLPFRVVLRSDWPCGGGLAPFVQVQGVVLPPLDVMHDAQRSTAPRAHVPTGGVSGAAVAANPIEKKKRYY